MCAGLADSDSDPDSDSGNGLAGDLVLIYNKASQDGGIRENHNTMCLCCDCN